MNHNTQQSTAQQIRHLLILIGSASLCALLGAILMLNHYGPSGQYSVENALLSPEIVPGLSYFDTNTKTSQNARFVFDGIQFSYYDSQLKRMQTKPVTVEEYRKFYDMISGEISLSEVSDNMMLEFEKTPPATLTLKVKPKSSADTQNLNKEFQQVQFANDSGYYRIELHEQNPVNKWVYFVHPDIYKQVMNLFIANP